MSIFDQLNLEEAEILEGLSILDLFNRRLLEPLPSNLQPGHEARVALYSARAFWHLPVTDDIIKETDHEL